MSWLEVVLKLGIILGIGWFFVSTINANLFHQNTSLVDTPEYKAAEQALKANNIAGARTQLNKFLASNQRSVDAYSDVFLLCASNRRADLLTEYASLADKEMQSAPGETRSNLHSALSAAYLSIEPSQKSLALKEAETANQLAPDLPEAMNTLAYTLAETSKDPAQLNRAQGLIVKALSQTYAQVGGVERQLHLVMYEDTYGWILYKKGLYGPAGEAAANDARAVDTLAQALSDLPPDASGADLKEIYYHLGAAYSKIGRPDQARNALLVALHYDPDYQVARQAMQTLPAPTPEPAPPSNPTSSKSTPKSTPSHSIPSSPASPAPTPHGPTKTPVKSAATRAFSPLSSDSPPFSRATPPGR
jgi:tetratricopeptide (TPR) repeat protein